MYIYIYIASAKGEHFHRVTVNPLPTTDANMRHELPYAHKNIYGGLILGINTLYRLFCFNKLFPMVGKGLTVAVQGRKPPAFRL